MRSMMKLRWKVKLNIDWCVKGFTVQNNFTGRNNLITGTESGIKEKQKLSNIKKYSQILSRIL